MNLSFFKRNNPPPQTHWLDQNELRKLQALAEKIKPSAASDNMQHAQYAGQFNSRNLGSGSDYAESRPYQMGDDPRAINWRLTARSQETFVKTYHSDSRPSLTILLDQRKTMLFGTSKRLKICQGLRASILLSKAANIHGLDFKAWVLSDHSLTFFDNNNAFLLKANKYQATHPPPFSDSNLDRLSSALKEIMPQLASGSLCYLISDFAGLQQQQLATLANHCSVQAFHIIDPAEVNLKNVGSLALEDSNQVVLNIESQNDKQRINITNKIAAITSARKKIITDLNINYTRIMTNDDNIQTQIYLPIKNLV